MAGDVRINPVALAQYINAPGGDTAKMLARSGVAVTGEAKRLVHQPGTGRTYTKSNPRRVHRASAPGKPPATDLGLLAASYNWAIGRDGIGIFCQVGSGLRKALYLERGTRNMAPRPALRIALRAARRRR